MFIIKVGDIKNHEIGLIKCSLEDRVDSIIDILKNLGAGYMGLQNY
jgi:hypothetical protein